VLFGVEKLEWCGYPMVKKIDNIFIRFDRIHDGVTDTQTDGQTPHDDMGRACIASRGKNDSYERSQSLAVLAE